MDREWEQGVLKERFLGGKPEFLIVYGRRRVGKTELLAHFMKNGPSGVYFLAEEKRYADNLGEMKELMGDFLKDEDFKIMKFGDWVHLFKSFSERLRERTVVVVDEFPYLVRENGKVTSEFQKIWDLYLSKSDRIMLVLVGSSVSMMEKLLGQKSPLFGRRTAQLEIKPLDVFRAREFLPGYGMEDCIRAYGCADGVPLYLKQFDDKRTVFENIQNAFFRKDALLYAEAEFLMKQEFREPANYFAILKALSFGNTRQNDIANYTGIEKSIISKYMQNLEKIRIIRREYPATERRERKKNALYVFSDNYFKFWFRFIYPSKAMIESGSANESFETMKKNYDAYLGPIFERVSADFLVKPGKFNFTKLGRWWHKDVEIDLIGLNENTKDIFFFECKWTNLGEKSARRILEELKGKSRFVDWRNNEGRTEHFGLIARRIENKDLLKKEGCLTFDLDDF